MEITTRSATSSDTEFARHAHHAAYRDLIERTFGRWIEQEQDGFFMESWQAAPHTLALCDGVPCGYICVESRDADVYVREIVMLPEFQGRGVGSSWGRHLIKPANATCRCA